MHPQVRSRGTHTTVIVAVFVGPGQPDTINDAGVVQLITEQGILFSEEGLKQTCVGIEAAGIEYGVFTTVELRYLLLQLLMNVLVQ